MVEKMRVNERVRWEDSVANVEEDRKETKAGADLDTSRQEGD
jgi:hypothetical protein